MKIDARTAAKILGGEVERPDRINVPGPGHSKRDRSLTVFFGDQCPEGFAVYSHAADDFRECRDYVRDKLGLPAWKLGDKSEQPVFVADEFTYEDARGNPYHRVTLMSDGTYRHDWFEIDGWSRGAPGIVVPFALADTQSDETIWLVRGEENARLIRDGFNQVATTYPSGLDVHADASFLHHLAGKDVRILHVGGAKSREFCRLFSDALDLPIWSLPDGVSTLRALARTEGGSLDQCVSGDEFEPVPPSVENDDTPAVPRIIATPFQWVDANLIPPREWLFGTHLIRKFVSLTVSPGGLGKSSLALVEALSLSSGRALFPDMTLHEPDPVRVWYWNGEDPNEETRRRVAAACLHYGLRAEDFASRFFADSGREQTITLGAIIKGEIDLDESLFAEIEATMLANEIDVLILDPFVSAHRMGENDNNAIDAVIKRLGKLAERTNAAVEVVHHVRKPSSGSTAQTDVNDARGASALLGGVRSARVLNVMSEDIAQAAGVPSDLRLRHFSVSDGKANMAPKADDVRWRFLESVCLGNQTETRKADNVGVVRHYALPESAKNAVDMTHAQDIALAILARDDTVRNHNGRGPAPRNWLGYLMADELGVDTDTETGKRAMGTIRSLIKSMIRDKTIHIRRADDGSRNIVEYLAAGERVDQVDERPDHWRDDDDPF